MVQQAARHDGVLLYPSPEGAQGAFVAAFAKMQTGGRVGVPYLHACESSYACAPSELKT